MAGRSLLMLALDKSYNNKLTNNKFVGKLQQRFISGAGFRNLTFKSGLFLKNVAMLSDWLFI